MINAAPLFNLYGLRSEEPTNVYLLSAPPSSGQQHSNTGTKRILHVWDNGHMVTTDHTSTSVWPTEYTILQ